MSLLKNCCRLIGACLLLSMSSLSWADEPDALHIYGCVDTGSGFNAAMAALRVDCDNRAETAGYTHGVVRKHLCPEGSVCLACLSGSIREACFGVGGGGDNGGGICGCNNCDPSCSTCKIC